MSSSLTLWNRMLSSLGFFNKSGQHYRKHGKSKLQHIRTLRTEPLENRELLSISYYWNPQSNPVWDTTTPNWYYIDGQQNHHQVAWGDGIDKNAVFQNSSTKTVTISGSIRANLIEFDIDGYKIKGGEIASGIDISVVSGVSATISSSIVNSGSASFVFKHDIGTLILDGSNTYTGVTWVNSGTLIATKPDSLPGYDTSGKVKVLDYGIENGNIDDGYGYSASTPAANMDPNSTLIVQGMGKDLGSGNTIGEGWDAGEIDGLLSQSSSIFETNTNFGIQAAANTEFDFSNHAIDITGVNVGIVKNSNK